MDKPACAMDQMPSPYRPVRFLDIKGWENDNLKDAFQCFLQTAYRMVEQPYTQKSIGFNSTKLLQTAKVAIERDTAEGSISGQTARRFFEECFTPVRFQGIDSGFVTGYYEPVVEASRHRSERFKFPLYRRPDDLIDVDDNNRPQEMDSYFRFGFPAANGIVPYMDRAAINAGGLSEKGLELFWLEDPVEVFFIHIQGSARLSLDDGSSAFVSYAAKTGHRFTAIGKILVDDGKVDRQSVSMNSIKTWLWNNPDQANALMELNQSYIFFREVELDNPDLGPIGAAGVQLTPQRSLAIDHGLHTFGTPVYVNCEPIVDEEAQSWSKLMIAQDTGSAIVGPQRGDLFVGSGLSAGNFAGQVKAEAEFIFLLPNPVGGASL